MTNEELQKLKAKAQNLKLNNQIIKECRENKDVFIDMEDEKVFKHLGVNMFWNFNDQLLEDINSWLNNQDDEIVDYVKEFLKEEYFPLINQIYNALDVTCYEDLLDLAFLLNKQMFFINNAKDNNEDIEITIYEIPFSLKKKLKKYNLIVQLENEVERILCNRYQEIAIYKVVDNKWESDITEGIIGKIGKTFGGLFIGAETHENNQPLEMVNREIMKGGIGGWTRQPNNSKTRRPIPTMM